jgi:hypothetical protein
MRRGFIQVAAGGGGVVAVAQTDTALVTGSTAAPLTFTGLAMGTAAADRISVAVINHRQREALTAVTINSVSATKAVAETVAGVSGNLSSEIWYAANPTGTTGNVTLDFNGNSSAAEVQCSVFSVTGSSGTPDSAVSNSANGVNDISVTATIAANGGLVAGGVHGEQTAAATWTNAAEDADADVTSFRGGTAHFTTAGTASRTYDGNDGEPHAITVAMWAP